MPLPINELVGLIAKTRPELLGELKEKYPNKAEYLEPGRIAGPTEDEINLEIDVALGGLTAALEKTAAALPKVASRIRKASQWQFFSQILTTLAGAAIFGVVASKLPDFAQYSVAVLGLGASLVAAYSTYLSKQPTASGQVVLVDIYKRLADASASASQLRMQLAAYKEHGIRPSAASDLIARANKLAEDLMTGYGDLLFAR